MIEEWISQSPVGRFGTLLHNLRRVSKTCFGCWFAGVLKHQQYALWTIHPDIQAEHIIKHDFTNILFIWHFWINIKNIAKTWKIRSTSSPPPPVGCVFPTSPPGHLGFHGVREVIDFDHYFGSNLSRWLPSWLHRLDRWKFSGFHLFVFLGKQVETPIISSLFMNKNKYVWLCICILVFWRYNVSHYI